MSAVAALAALTLGVAGTTAAQATEQRERAAAASVTDDWGPEFEFSSHEAFVSYLDSAEGQQLLREEGLTQAEITAVYAGDDVAAKGWLDKLKKKALKKAFKALVAEEADRLGEEGQGLLQGEVELPSGLGEEGSDPGRRDLRQDGHRVAHRHHPVMYGFT
jgi:hypothetical protein